MTVKDKRIQDLRLENEGLREELQIIVEAMQACRYCKHLDADCSPGTKACKPEWRGMKRERA